MSGQKFKNSTLKVKRRADLAKFSGSHFLEPMGGVDRVEGERERAGAEEFVNGKAAAGPGAVVVKGNEAARNDGIVEGLEAELDGFVPVGVEVEKSNLRDARSR